MEWCYTAKSDANLDGYDVTTHDVWYDDRTGQWWSGLTHYVNPRDYSDRPSMAHMTLADAIARCEESSRADAADARWMTALEASA